VNNELPHSTKVTMNDEEERKLDKRRSPMTIEK